MGSVLRLATSARREARNRIAHFRDPVAYWRDKGATIGDNCRLIGCSFGSEPYLVTLGDHVSATTTAFVTHDGGVWVFREQWPDIDVIAPITVGDNVFLGSGSLVLPGVTIGSDVVLGARSLVVKDIPSGSVAAGAPARVLRDIAEYRAASEQRAVPTARMEPVAKRAWLEAHFASGSGPGAPGG